MLRSSIPAVALLAASIADVNNDDVVDVLDLLIVLDEWGDCPES